MLPAYIFHNDCIRHEMGDQHPECPERIGAVKDHLLMQGILNFMQSYEAPLATEQQIVRAHTLSYIQKLAALAPVAGYAQIDPDTFMNPASYQAALRAAGAAVLGTDLVLTGKASVAFCNVRPPGHHAKRAAAAGFCFFNNVVIGIRHALEVHGLQRVALIDFDVHHGDGSEDILWDDPRVLMCSTFQNDIYPYSGIDPKGPNMINVGLPARTGGKEFRSAVKHNWLPALHEFKPQMIFISAGFDGHREDDMANLSLVEADYEWVTQQVVEVAQLYSQGRIVSCLEGGYAISALGRSAAAHVRALTTA